MGLRCMRCGHKVDKLYVQYSPGNIRLIKCQICKSVADEYIECEPMIVAIDLILHKPQAYRHLLFNTLNSSNFNHAVSLSLKLSLAIFLLDALRMLILNNNLQDWSIYATGLRIIVSAVFGNLLFLGAFVGLSVKLLRLVDGFSDYEDVLMAVLVSSYLKGFLLAMVVWEFPPLVVYIIDLFVVSSNLVALRVISESSLMRCLGVCLTAHAAKFLLHLCFC